MFTAFVMIEAEPDKIAEIARSIANMPNVAEVYSVTGDFDILVVLRLSEFEQLAESVLDAFSLWVTGLRDVSCLFGAVSLPVDLEALLGRFTTQEVVFCLDGDRAGQEATVRHAELLSQSGVRCLSVALPMGRDPNQLLLQEGAELLRERMLQARPVAFEGAAEPAAPPPPAPLPSTPKPKGGKK